ncbi:hypothetical protein PR048_010554 [Dryococelus australis]|uniref:Uncharacterized protein n=1 Tax=Dryococelus australis TaxID=614101 RepID=A0ABQ9I306_9NEOP|nr:hypothetical protein PR048_010554 [Dryococelus australis]
MALPIGVEYLRGEVGTPLSRAQLKRRGGEMDTNKYAERVGAKRWRYRQISSSPIGSDVSRTNSPPLSSPQLGGHRKVTKCRCGGKRESPEKTHRPRSQAKRSAIGVPLDRRCTSFAPSPIELVAGARGLWATTLEPNGLMNFDINKHLGGLLGSRQSGGNYFPPPRWFVAGARGGRGGEVVKTLVREALKLQATTLLGIKLPLTASSPPRWATNCALAPEQRTQTLSTTLTKGRKSRAGIPSRLPAASVRRVLERVSRTSRFELPTTPLQPINHPHKPFRHPLLSSSCISFRCLLRELGLGVLNSTPPPSRGGPRLDHSPSHQGGFHSRIFGCGNRTGRCRWSAGFLGDIPALLHTSLVNRVAPLRFEPLHLRHNPVYANFAIRENVTLNGLNKGIVLHSSREIFLLVGPVGLISANWRRTAARRDVTLMGGEEPRWLSGYSLLASRQGANRVQSPVGSLPDFRVWESCRTMPLVGGFFSRGYFAAPCSLPSPSSAFKTSLRKLIEALASPSIDIGGWHPTEFSMSHRLEILLPDSAQRTWTRAFARSQNERASTSELRDALPGDFLPRHKSDQKSSRAPTRTTRVSGDLPGRRALNNCFGFASHAHAYASHADAYASHADAYASHADAYASHADAYASHADAYASHADAYASHADAYASHADAYASHADGYTSRAGAEESG